MNSRFGFDPKRAKGPREEPDVVAHQDQAGQDVTADIVGGATGPAPRARAGMSVSGLLASIKQALAAHMPRRVTVIGEISNFKRHSSGHMYFSLKDAQGQIGAVMFRSAASKVRFTPADGLEVVIEGSVDLYEPQGKLQLYVESMSPNGTGELELAYRQLVEKLRAQGLFELARKRPLPRFPETICVITSPTGAAIRDIRRTLARRWPGATVYLIPVRVQGEGAAEEIARAIQLAHRNADRLGLEVLIVGRGGGSIEDLWCFNEEVVARAIFGCCIPVVSGVGHETDTTIADLVADVRAATPTAAAELATPDGLEVRKYLAELAGRLVRRVRNLQAQGLGALRMVQRSEFFRNPMHRILTLSQRTDQLAGRARSLLIQRHGLAKSAIETLAAGLRWHLGGLAKRKATQLDKHYAGLMGAHPIQRVKVGRCDVELAQRQLATLEKALMAASAAQVDRYRRTLEALSYRNVLKRGYSVTRLANGQIIRQADQAQPGQSLRTELGEGEIRSIVEGPPRPKLKKATGEEGPTLF